MLILEGRKVEVEKAPVPYRYLLTDVSIWTSLLMFVGYYVGMIIYQQYSPTFIKQVRFLDLLVEMLHRSSKFSF